MPPRRVSVAITQDAHDGPVGVSAAGLRLGGESAAARRAGPSSTWIPHHDSHEPCLRGALGAHCTVGAHCTATRVVICLVHCALLLLWCTLVTWAARDAKCRLDRVSDADAASGDRLHTSSALELVALHSASCSTCDQMVTLALSDGHFESRPFSFAVASCDEPACDAGHACCCLLACIWCATSYTAAAPCTCVSLELRYGIWAAPCWSAEMTSPSADSERLMLCASFSCCPAASDLATRSEPVQSLLDIEKCVNSYQASRSRPGTARLACNGM